MPRPALVISSEGYSYRHKSCICLMVTTTHDIREDDIEINDLISTGLHRASRIRFKFASIDLAQIEKRLGVIDKITQQAVERNIKNCLTKLE